MEKFIEKPLVPSGFNEHREIGAVRQKLDDLVKTWNGLARSPYEKELRDKLIAEHVQPMRKELDDLDQAV